MLHGPGDLAARRVVERQNQRQPLSFGRFAFGLGEVAADLVRKTAPVADHGDAHSLPLELGRFACDAAAEELHQGVYFGCGTAPVLGREGIECQVLHAPAHGGTQRSAHGLDTRGVTFVTLLAVQPGPPAVAVHDDGDVLRYAFRLAHIRAQIYEYKLKNPSLSLIFTLSFRGCGSTSVAATRTVSRRPKEPGAAVAFPTACQLRISIPHIILSRNVS